MGRTKDMYVTAVMDLDVFSQIDYEIQQQMNFTIRERHEYYEKSEKYKMLAGALRKAKKELIQFEFELNHERK